MDTFPRRGHIVKRTPQGVDGIEHDPELLESGDQVGTAPSDRRFRRDVQGLRAVAVALVVLYHANFRLFPGGFVGVDVFFVISGFVITGVLLRHARGGGGVAFADFYARRSRRIIPASALVIIIVVVAEFRLNGVIYGSLAALVGKAASIFMANIHFARVGTNYFTSTRPPSPFLNFWSLAVEEQFYLVYPALFLGVIALRVRRSVEARLIAFLSLVIVASFSLSVIQTASNPAVAFYSPLTRAWELALGGLVACAAPWLLKLPVQLRSAITWLGLAGIVVAALAFSTSTAYPGWLVALPVVGTGMVIAGGTGPIGLHRGAELILGLRPFQAFGSISYSWYLWHWPILVIAAECAGRHRLGFRENIPYLALGLAAAIATYLVVENPIRHLAVLRRLPWASIGVGVVITAVTFAFTSANTNGFEQVTRGLRVERPLVTTQVVPAPQTGLPPAEFNSRVGADGPLVPAAVVAGRVQASASITSIPSDITPSLVEATKDVGIPLDSPCWLTDADQWKSPVCTYGDRHAQGAMVLFGDSHAAMWFGVLNKMARAAHLRLVLFSKAACPVASVMLTNPTTERGPWTACERWREDSIARINELHPQLVVIGEAGPDVPEAGIRASAYHVTSSRWQVGVATSLGAIDVAPASRFVIGNVPPHVTGPVCLSQHTNNVQACSVPVAYNRSRFSSAEERATLDSGSSFVDAWPWFCATTCSSVIGRYVAYFDPFHVTNTYALTLQGVLAKALSS
jgi:prepilin-type processing-associated H-X9-DG protein